MTEDIKENDASMAFEKAKKEVENLSNELALVKNLLSLSYDEFSNHKFTKEEYDIIIPSLKFDAEEKLSNLKQAKLEYAKLEVENME